MKKVIFPIATFTLILLLAACNGDSKSSTPTAGDTPAPNNAPASNTGTASTPPTDNFKIIYTAGGAEIKSSASLLVTKDKDKLKPGYDYFCMMTCNGGANNSSLVLNFLLNLKTGACPVVGFSYNSKKDSATEMYGGLMGGKAKLTDYTVNITDCTDLGSNNMGGHKWKISGTFESITIPAMGIMLMDKTKNHPKEIKIEKGSFKDLSFDDNWEEMANAAMKKMAK